MSLRINTNVEAFNAHRNLSNTSMQLGSSMERLSSGLRINRAGDDAAGLAISEKLRAQINGVGQAQRNAQDGISMVQTAEGALTEVHSMLQRVRELAVQYQNETLSDDDRDSIDSEVKQLGLEIKRTSASSEFNTINLLSSTNTVSFQVGANDGETIGVKLIDLNADLKGAIGTELDAIDLTGDNILASLDGAIASVSTARGNFGAVQNRLEHTLNSLSVYQENLTASESRIRDIDVAEEMVQFTKYQILSQAGTAMLAQANQAPQSVLRLLG
jgi:flagellin